MAENMQYFIIVMLLYRFDSRMIHLVENLILTKEAISSEALLQIQTIR